MCRRGLRDGPTLVSTRVSLEPRAIRRSKPGLPPPSPRQQKVGLAAPGQSFPAKQQRTALLTLAACGSTSVKIRPHAVAKPSEAARHPCRWHRVRHGGCAAARRHCGCGRGTGAALQLGRSPLSLRTGRTDDVRRVQVADHRRNVQKGSPCREGMDGGVRAQHPPGSGRTSAHGRGASLSRRCPRPQRRHIASGAARERRRSGSTTAYRTADGTPVGQIESQTADQLELRYRLEDGQRMGQVFDRPERLRGLATRAIALARRSDVLRGPS